MDQPDWEKLLKASLTDRRLSDAEKKVIDAFVDSSNPEENRLAKLRSKVFDLAREEVADPKVAEIFDWLEDVIKRLTPRRELTRPRRSEAWFAPEHFIPGRICELFREARNEIWVCVFTITDDRITDCILDAHHRGVKIRIISDHRKSYDKGSDLEHLHAKGIPVRFDEGEAHMHHKFALFDRRVLLNGSYNWTRGASDLNRENIVIEEDSKLVEVFSRYFEELWEKLGN